MKYTTINERAAAQAMTFVAGDPARICIENLYKIIDGAMQDAYAEGYEQAQATATLVAKQPAFEPVFADDEAIDISEPWNPEWDEFCPVRSGRTDRT